MCQSNRTKYKDGMVKVLSQKEWERLNSWLHKEEINASKCQREFEERERIKQESYEIHKHWTNTVMGMRNRKLEAREERLRKEEEERVAVDKAWAKQQAEERRQKLCLARTLKLYTVPRIKHFHTALHIGDAMKENELQLELKKLKSEAAAKKGEIELEAMKKSFEEAEKEERQKYAERQAAERAISEEQLRQIQERRELEEREKAELVAEREVIRQLAKEAEERNFQLREEKCRLQRKAIQDQLDEIEYKKKWLRGQRADEEKEDERELLFVAAKRKIGIMSLEKEAAAKAARDAVREKMVDFISDKIQKENAFREASLKAAMESDNAKWNKRVEDEARKKEDTLKEIEAHRQKTLKENEELRVRQAEEAKEDLERRKALDEKHRCEDEERKAQNRQKCQELVEIYKQEIKRHEEEKLKARLEDTKYLQSVEEQEEMFQNYAKRAIKNCEETGIPTYAMKKVANQKLIDGFGITKAETDESEECELLPDLPPFKVHLSL
ncbi:unnamed protein product [Rodentolepis nana]|uniref:TPH domain-containing protein n=1 Tax=Rodentolepis nana TaxID=102285 RepID=A0A158QJC1_RODNA|nr:unnamed protein product [Rodentolepis nana]